MFVKYCNKISENPFKERKDYRLVRDDQVVPHKDFTKKSPFSNGNYRHFTYIKKYGSLSRFGAAFSIVFYFFATLGSFFGNRNLAKVKKIDGGKKNFLDYRDKLHYSVKVLKKGYGFKTVAVYDKSLGKNYKPKASLDNTKFYKDQLNLLEKYIEDKKKGKAKNQILKVGPVGDRDGVVVAKANFWDRLRQKLPFANKNFKTIFENYSRFREKFTYDPYFKDSYDLVNFNEKDLKKYNKIAFKVDHFFIDSFKNTSVKIFPIQSSMDKRTSLTGRSSTNGILSSYLFGQLEKPFTHKNLEKKYTIPYFEHSQYPNIHPSFFSDINDYVSKSKLGDPYYSNMLGFIYEHGFGVKKNRVKAKEFYKVASAQQDAPGNYNLGRLYFQEGNKKEAKKHFLKASERVKEDMKTYVNKNAKDLLKTIEIALKKCN